LARAFAPFTSEVLGIDPEPEMLRLAERDAPANVRFLEGSSYGLGPDLGMFRLVTMGRSFHWMDRVDTLRRLDRMIEPGGAVALFGDKHPELPENAWRQAFQNLVGRYAADDPHRHQRHRPGRGPAGRGGGEHGAYRPSGRIALGNRYLGRHKILFW
jgi:ubiquinone/menaquinone biosynthesis C-methylase UbiE